MINAVIDFRVDIGLIEGPCHNVDIIAEPGWRMSWWCLPLRPLLYRGEVTLERLAQAQWILREQGSGTREIVDYLLLSHLPQFQLGMELGNSEAIKHAVRHGLGISCLSRRVIAEQLETGSLVEIPFRCRSWCARCGASIIVRNTFPARSSVFCATARCKSALPSPQRRGKIMLYL